MRALSLGRRREDERLANAVDSSLDASRRDAFPAWVIAVASLVVLAGVALRFLTRSDLWLDEALTVTIAKLPFGEMHEALRHDGAPPLFYWLLHVWMSVFGESDLAVRSLAGVVSVATLPLAWFAGRRLGRPGPPGPLRDDAPATRLTAGLVLLVLATSPYAVRYATEARMYALVMFLVTGGYLALRRAAERPAFGRLALVALITGALLYSHYWTIYLLAVVVGGLLWRAFRASDHASRGSARRILLAIVAGSLLLIPWLPTFAYQFQHTGTPWGPGRPTWTTLRQALDQFANGTGVFHGTNNLLALVLLALALLALLGAAAGPRNVDLDLRTRPPVRWEWATAFVTLVLALSIAWLSDGAFDARYAAMMFPLFVMVVAWGFTVFESRTLLAIVVAATLGLQLVAVFHNVRDQRTQAGAAAAVIRAEAQPGDLVVYCPDQLGPATDRLLLDRPDLRQTTYPADTRPDRVDWVDYSERIDSTDPARFAQTVLERAGPDRTIWYVNNEDYYGVTERCDAIADTLAAAREGRPTRVVGRPDRFFESMDLDQFPPP
jgi:hypothetical protein